MKRPIHLIPLAILAALMAALPAKVFAHAFLDHSQPKVGSERTTAPTEVKIWFTQDIEPAFSSIEVRDGKDHQVDKQDCHGDDSDHKELLVSLSKLPPGEYVVKWKAVSVDTHHTNGTFKFTVKAAK